MEIPFDHKKFKEMQVALANAFARINITSFPYARPNVEYTPWRVKSIFTNLNKTFGASLLETKTPWHALISVMEYEKKIYQFITAQLIQLNRNKSLIQQLEQCKEIVQCFEVLRSINAILILHAPNILLDYKMMNSIVGSHIQEIYRRMNIKPYIAEEILNAIRQDQQNYIDTNQRATQFLQHMKNFMLLCLLKASYGENGIQLISLLAESFKTKDHTITLSVIEVLSNQGLQMGMEDVTKAEAKLTDRETKLALPTDIKMKLFSQIKQGAGCSSTMPCPVWFSSAEEYNDKAGREIYFSNNDVVNQAVWRLLSGAIAFDKDGSPFYTPVHIHVLHEFIHGLHFSQGISLTDFAALPPEGLLDIMQEMQLWRGMWSNMEEYHCIDYSIYSTENKLNQDLGITNRFGHRAVLEDIFFARNHAVHQDELAQSLNQLSGIPDYIRATALLSHNVYTSSHGKSAAIVQNEDEREENDQNEQSSPSPRSP